MDKYYALLKKNIVVQIIVANEEFLKHVQDDHDGIIDITNMNRPSIGDHYLKETHTFLANNRETIELPYDPDSDHLQNGTEEGFEPFNISKYSVKYDNGYVFVGCKKYSAPGLLDALHKTLIEKRDQTACFRSDKEGPGDGKFNITWEDARKLYEALKMVKF